MKRLPALLCIVVVALTLWATLAHPEWLPDTSKLFYSRPAGGQ
jgi:hypothetical protein